MIIDRFDQLAGGINWYCETRGAGPWVVLIPSGEGDCANFDQTAGLLADRFRVLTFDTPGFSRTTAPVALAEVSISALAGQIAGLVQSLGIEQATFYGCSSGGRAVLDLVAGRPELVRNAIVHEAALPSPSLEAQLAPLVALDDAAVVEACKQMFAYGMNEDAAAWSALGSDYHSRLEKNYLTWVRCYLAQGMGQPIDPADLAGKPVCWTVGELSDQAAFEGNFQVARAAGLAVAGLPCRHFPQVSMPALLAGHIAAATAPYL